MMADALTPIVAKLATFIRLLSSDKDGEVIAAARAMQRTLRSAGADIHTLANRVEKPNGSELSEEDMKRLYNAGYEDGRRAAENAQYGPGDFHNIDGTPCWHELAVECQQRSARLRDKEKEFVDDMAARTVWREPTERQGKWLLSIYYRLGGKRP
jgi:hypothetical protein